MVKALRPSILCYMLLEADWRVYPRGSAGKESTCNAGDLGLISGWGRSPGAGNGNPLQYSCLELPWMEELGGLQSMGHKKSDTTERLHFHFQ